MSAIFSRPGQVLSVREREHIRNRLKANEQALQGKIVVETNKAIGPEGLSKRRQGRYESFLRQDIQEDQGLLRAKIERDKALLKAGDPGSLSKREKTALEKRAMVLREILRGRMCPARLFRTPSVTKDGTKHPNFDRAVEACKQEHSEEYKRFAAEYKKVMRQIDPENPSASNLETIRPK